MLLLDILPCSKHHASDYYHTLAGVDQIILTFSRFMMLVLYEFVGRLLLRVEEEGGREEVLYMYALRRQGETETSAILCKSSSCAIG